MNGIELRMGKMGLQMGGIWSEVGGVGIDRASGG